VKHKNLKSVFALPILDDKAIPNFYHKLCELLTNLKNTFYEFGTLLHTFDDAHSITILSELKMSSFGLYAGAKARSPSIALSTALC